jgi:hypothetical protein
VINKDKALYKLTIVPGEKVSIKRFVRLLLWCSSGRGRAASTLARRRQDLTPFFATAGTREWRSNTGALLHDMHALGLEPCLFFC